MLGGKGEKGKGNIRETTMKFDIKCRDTGVALPQLKMGCKITCIMKVVIAVELYT